MDFILFVLSKIISKLLAENYLVIRERIKLDSAQKSSKFLPQIIMTLESSANNIGSDTAFIVRGRSYILWTMEDLELIDPWGNSTFQCIPAREKILNCNRWSNFLNPPSASSLHQVKNSLFPFPLTFEKPQIILLLLKNFS